MYLILANLLYMWLFWSINVDAPNNAWIETVDVFNNSSCIQYSNVYIESQNSNKIEFEYST